MQFKLPIGNLSKNNPSETTKGVVGVGGNRSTNVRIL
jgi:hypothetical protein